MDKLEAVCDPKKNLTVERFNFFNVVLTETEPFESFLTELQTKAFSCEFGDQCDSLIRNSM